MGKRLEWVIVSLILATIVTVLWILGTAFSGIFFFPAAVFLFTFIYFVFRNPDSRCQRLFASVAFVPLSLNFAAGVAQALGDSGWVSGALLAAVNVVGIYVQNSLQHTFYHLILGFSFLLALAELIVKQEGIFRLLGGRGGLSVSASNLRDWRLRELFEQDNRRFQLDCYVTLENSSPNAATLNYQDVDFSSTFWFASFKSIRKMDMAVYKEDLARLLDSATIEVLPGETLPNVHLTYQFDSLVLKFLARRMRFLVWRVTLSFRRGRFRALPADGFVRLH